MNALNKLLDKARKVCGSDLATAAKLHVSRSAVSKWRKGGKIDPSHLANLIELTHQDPAVAVQVLAEQDATPVELRMWGAVWDRLSPVTTVIGVALLLGFAPLAKADRGATLMDAPCMHYAKSLVRALTRWLLNWSAARSVDHAPALLAVR